MARRSSKLPRGFPPLVSHDFGTWAQYLASCERAEPLPGAGDSSNLDDPAFNGVHSYTEALQLARDGWPEGLARIAEAAQQIDIPELHGRAPSLSYDVAGVYPSVPRAVAGDPCSMVQPGDVFVPRPVARFWISLNKSAAVRPEACANRGAAILAACDILESRGTRVELEVFTCAASDDNAQQFREFYTLKRADEPVELDRLAFVLMHPAALRCLSFRQREADPRLYFPLWQSYGRPIDLPREMIEERNTLYFGPMKLEWTWDTVQSAQAYVVQCLSQLNKETIA